jgi:hypothetical protein
LGNRNTVQPTQLHLFNESEELPDPGFVDKPELEYPEVEVQCPQPQYPLPEFVQNDPQFAEMLLQRLEVEEEKCLREMAEEEDGEYIEEAIKEYGDDPEEEGLYHLEESGEEWSPGLNLVAPMSTPEPRRDPEGLLKAYLVANPNLPVYVAQIGPPQMKLPEEAANLVLVRTIMDTGAVSNYITSHKARLAKAQIFEIDEREIVGAGRTMTSAFARFILKIGGLQTSCLAYVLNNDAHFRYDLLLGCAWLKKFEAAPQWKDDSYVLTDLVSHACCKIKPLVTKKRDGSPKGLINLVKGLLPKHPAPIPPVVVDPLHLVQGGGMSEDNLTKTDDKSTLAQPPLTKESPNNIQSSFGECVKDIIKHAIPLVFRDKVGYPLPRKWEHTIDIGGCHEL